MRNLRYIRLLAVGLALAFVLFGAVPTRASSANISRAYHSDTPFKNGSLVSLDPERSEYVLLANTSNGQRLLGIAVASQDSLLAVNPGVDTIQVATNGTANVLVSTLNGDILVGDQIAVSPFDGVGMKATPGSRIAGLAQTSFNARTTGATQQQVKDKNGRTSQIEVGFVRLGISPGSSTTQVESDSQINSLQKLAKTFTGHTVSTFRVIISLIIAVVSVVSIVTLMYASIYGSIISIGRNPLAKFAVYRSLSSVLTMAGLTALVAGVTIFLLLY